MSQDSPTLRGRREFQSGQKPHGLSAGPPQEDSAIAILEALKIACVKHIDTNHQLSGEPLATSLQIAQPQHDATSSFAANF
jgi:hypothetical protein